MTGIRFPPLFSGYQVVADTDPFDLACEQAADDCDPGSVFYKIDQSQLQAAIVFAPDIPLSEAAVLLPVCGVGFQSAFGALAPPEVAVHLDWDGGIRINGALCGELRIDASTAEPDCEPDWVVVGLSLTLRGDGGDPGNSPGKTALFDEGCGDVEPGPLLESWTRHTLVWLNRWNDEGTGPLLSVWRGLAYGIGQNADLAGLSGKFVEVDGHFNAHIETDGKTIMLPLTVLVGAKK